MVSDQYLADLRWSNTLHLPQHYCVMNTGQTLQVTARQDAAPQMKDSQPWCPEISIRFDSKSQKSPRLWPWPSNSPDPKAIQDCVMLIYPLPDKSETKRTQWQLRTMSNYQGTKFVICHWSSNNREKFAPGYDPLEPFGPRKPQRGTK